MRWASSAAHLVYLEKYSYDSLWTHCKCFYSSASVDHSSHVFTGGEVCFARMFRLVLDSFFPFLFTKTTVRLYYIVLLNFLVDKSGSPYSIVLLVHRVATTEVVGDTSATRVGCTPHRHCRPQKRHV